MVDKLPAEIIVNIFNNLGTTDLLTVSVVCQKWRQIALILIVDRVQVVIAEETETVVDMLKVSRIRYKHWLFKSLELKPGTKFLSIWDDYANIAASLSFIDVEISEKDLWILLSECDNLRELHLGGLGPMFMTVYFLDNKHNQKPIINVLSKLSSFHLTGSRYLSDAIFSHITGQLKSLETFSLSGCQISYQQSIYKRFYPQNKGITASKHVFTFKHVLNLIELNAPSLKSIRLCETTIDNQSLRDLSLIKNLSLESLELISCNQLTRVGIQNLVEHQRNLTSLDLSFCSRITDYGLISIIENIPRIKHLNLSRCRSVSEIGLGMLTKLIHLEWLNISGLCTGNWKCIDEALGKFVRLPLKWLNCGFTSIHFETVSSLAETAPNLEHLDLSHCTCGVNDETIQSLFKLKNLKSLEVGACAALSDTGIAGVVATYEDIEMEEAPLFEGHQETLGVKRRDHFKVNLDVKAEQAIRNIAEVKRFVDAHAPSSSLTKVSNLKGLRKLGLSGCIRVTDVTLSTAISFNELFALDLSHCKKLGDNGIIPMVNVCTALEELILNECASISDQAVLVIAHRLRRLKVLSLQNCIRLTDDSIDSLSNCTGLRDLDVSNCIKITKEQIFTLKSRLPRISNLNYRNIKSSSPYIDCTGLEEIRHIPTPPPLLSKLLKKLSR